MQARSNRLGEEGSEQDVPWIWDKKVMSEAERNSGCELLLTSYGKLESSI